MTTMRRMKTIATREEPLRLAWVGQMQAAVPLPGHRLHVFDDSDDFLLSGEPMAHHVYVIGLRQRSMPGLHLLKVVRRARPDAAVIALDDLLPSAFVEALDAGADMVLRPFSPPEHLRAAVEALNRRRHESAIGWRLLSSPPRLLGRPGVEVGLSAGEHGLLEALRRAEGQVVPREVLLRCLWPQDRDPGPQALHAAVYRLRKRVEAAGGGLLPVQAVPQRGYRFRAPLAVA